MKTMPQVALVASALLLSTASASSGEEDRAVAIVVHTTNPLHTVSLDEVRRYFSEEKRQWPDQKDVHVWRTSGGFEANLMNAKVHGRNGDDVRARRLQKVASHESQATPVLPSSKSVKRRVSSDPLAIGFIDASLLDDTIKALRVGGRQPTQPGYPLTEGRSGHQRH